MGPTRSWRKRGVRPRGLPAVASLPPDGGTFMADGCWMRRGMIGRLMIFILAAVALGLADRAAAQAGRPNILYIMADDHASHALSCYGSKINQTPNLDRLAAQGMRFENAFVTNALCGPSRACVLTGK